MYCCCCCFIDVGWVCSCFAISVSLSFLFFFCSSFLPSSFLPPSVLSPSSLPPSSQLTFVFILFFFSLLFLLLSSSSSFFLSFFQNELIGQFSFGIQKVWSQPKPTAHQFYKKWIILTDPQDAYEQMGFVLCSVTVLGPGDAPPTHTEEFLEPEVLRSPSGLGNTRRGYNMIVKAYRGEEIASDDGSEGGCDPFLSVKFNGIVMRTQPEVCFFFSFFFFGAVLSLPLISQWRVYFYEYILTFLLLLFRT